MKRKIGYSVRVRNMGGKRLALRDGFISREVAYRYARRMADKYKGQLVVVNRISTYRGKIYYDATHYFWFVDGRLESFSATQTRCEVGQYNPLVGALRRRFFVRRFED